MNPSDSLVEDWNNALQDEIVFSHSRATYVLSWQLLERNHCLLENVNNLKDEIKLQDLTQSNNCYQIYASVLNELSVPYDDNVKLLLPNIFLPTRKSALTMFASMAIRLDSGRKMGNHDNGCILSGPKGIGKSTFLHCFAIATAVVTNNTTVIYSNCSVIAQLPSELLIQAYAYDCQIPAPELNSSNLSDVLSYLKKCTRKFILVLDEYHHVFKKENNSHYHEQLYLLGNDTTGQFATFISGSDSALLSLAYANISLETARSLGYHSYEQKSLNYERYAKARISRITTSKEFEDLLTHISDTVESRLSFFTEEDVKKLKSYQSKEQLSMMYTFTGGRFRAIQQFLDNPSRCVSEEVEKFLIRTEDPTFAKVLNLLLKEHDKFYGMHPNEQDWGFTYVSHKEITDWNLVYQYSNSGMLYMDTSDYFVPKITFASKLHELLWRNKTAAIDELTPYQCICLRYPYGQLGIDAETLVCESLIENRYKFGFPQLTYTNRQFSMLPTISNDTLSQSLKNHLGNSNVIVCGNPQQWTKPKQHKTTTDLLKNFVVMPTFELLKEQPDKYGADVIFFDGVTVHRIQIKLGTSTITNDNLRHWFTKLENGDNTIRLIEGFKEVPIIHYLLTTRNLPDELKNRYEKDNRKIFDNQDMSKLWKSSITNFAKQLNIKTYLAAEPK